MLGADIRAVDDLRTVKRATAAQLGGQGWSCCHDWLEVREPADQGCSTCCRSAPVSNQAATRRCWVAAAACQISYRHLADTRPR